MNKTPGQPELNAESLSTWLDSESYASAETLDRVLNDPELLEKWEHYHLISDYLAGRCAELETAEQPVTKAQAILRPLLRVPLGIAASAAIVTALAATAILLLPERQPATSSVAAVQSPAGDELTPGAMRCQGDCAVSPLTAAEPQSAAKRRLASYLVGHGELTAAGAPDKALAYARIVGQGQHDE